MPRLLLFLVSFIAAWTTFMTPLYAARIKDIAHVQGVRDNQLMGYGLIVGLDGTGDMGQAELTAQTTASMLTRMGIRVDKNMLKQSRNIAAVMVTANLPAFARPGQKLDVTIASIGNARSLQGGTLLMTPLKAADGKIYAVAQGSLTVGGYAAEGKAGNIKVKNHLNVGRIPSGASIERAVAIDLTKKDSIRLNLFESDFTTAVAVATRISETFAPPKEEKKEEPAAKDSDKKDPKNPADKDTVNTKAVAKKKLPTPSKGIALAVDGSTVLINIPDTFKDHVPEFIAVIERLEVKRDSVARVVINERTGTVVLGGAVRIATVAIAHGNLNVEISTTYEASQPSAFRGQGETAVLPTSQVNAEEQKAQLKVLRQGATIGEVVSALNAIGVTPRDLIAILQAIKTAGALDAELIVQ